MIVENISSEEPQKTGLEEKQHPNSILLLKKQGLKPKFKSFICGGWGGWIRTNE